MKVQWFTDSCDICFISKSRTQEISKRVHHNIQYSAIFGLSYGLRMTNLYFFSGSFCLHFVPASNLGGHAKNFRLTDGRWTFSIGWTYSRNPSLSQSVGLSYAMINFAQKWPDTTYCGVLFLKSLEFWIWIWNKYRWNRCTTELSCYGKWSAIFDCAASQYMWRHCQNTNFLTE